VRQAGTVIEEGLLELSGRGARELLNEYLVASRQRRKVLAISDEVLIGSSAVTRALGDLGRDELWPLVRDSLRSADAALLPLLGNDDDVVTLRLRAVHRATDGRLAGAIAEVVEDGARPAVRESAVRKADNPWAGLSPLIIGPMVVLGELAAARSPACLIGEPGVGKQTIAEEIARKALPGRLSTVYRADHPHANSLTDQVKADLGSGHPVVVKDVDRLPADVLRDLVALAVADPPSPGWLALTLCSGRTASETAEQALAMAGVALVVVPPVRSRIQDLHHILPTMVRRISGGRVTRVSDGLMDRLTRASWPGNLSEVASLVASVVPTVAGDTLELAHLPADFGRGARHRLTRLEVLEREAIIEALRSCGQDKLRAAEALGISRASIYRKIKQYEIDAAEL
jgi:hypothetical protein